jgi:hypothetical protein
MSSIYRDVNSLPAPPKRFFVDLHPEVTLVAAQFSLRFDPCDTLMCFKLRELSWLCLGRLKLNTVLAKRLMRVATAVPVDTEFSRYHFADNDSAHQGSADYNLGTE